MFFILNLSLISMGDPIVFWNPPNFIYKSQIHFSNSTSNDKNSPTDIQLITYPTGYTTLQ